MPNIYLKTFDICASKTRNCTFCFREHEQWYVAIPGKLLGVATFDQSGKETMLPVYHYQHIQVYIFYQPVQPGVYIFIPDVSVIYLMIIDLTGHFAQKGLYFLLMLLLYPFAGNMSDKDLCIKLCR